MMKIFSLTLFLLVACSPPAISAELKPSPPPVSSKISEREACTGIWRSFGNGCKDYCYSGKKPRRCTMVYASGCDCGPDQCFDPAQNKCVDNPK